MRLLTAAERATVDALIADAESTLSGMVLVLAPNEPAVREVRAARDWLRGVRATGRLTGPGTVRLRSAPPDRHDERGESGEAGQRE